MKSHPSREILFRWLLAAACFGLLIVVFSPAWWAFRLAARLPEMQAMIEVRRGVSVLQQVAHPGTEISDSLHRVIQWRLLFPLVGHMLDLPHAWFFGLAHLGCLLVLFYLAALLRRHGLQWIECALALVTVGAASWFFTATGWLGYFDSWLVLGLLLVAFAEAPWIVWCACLLTPWVDERFVISAPLALLCRWFRPPVPSDGAPRPFNLRLELIVPALLLGAFLGVRLGVLSNHSAEGATIGGYFAGRNFLDAPVSRIALGVWEGLRAGWIFAAAAVVLLWPQRFRAVALGGAMLLTLGVGLATAQDYSRSMTMVFPAAVFGLLAAVRAPGRWLPVTLRVSAFVALLLPAHHVMNNLVNPIYYLHHELALLNSPPPFAMPELYELRAIHRMERGEFGPAESDLSLAIKLAENPASPARQRGILAASQNRWADALRDFSTLVKYDAKNPDSWFMRAQANLAVGDATSAHADFEQARSLASSDWVTRPDVARFLARLNSHP